MVTSVCLFTLPALAVKDADAEPCGMVTDVGTVAPAFELVRVTVTPPLPAGAEMVTVPIEVCPF